LCDEKGVLRQHIMLDDGYLTDLKIIIHQIWESKITWKKSLKVWIKELFYDDT
jgi:hypothetical protein